MRNKPGLMTAVRNLALVAATLCGAGLAHADTTCLGVTLPAGSKKVEGSAPEECRFVSSLGWDSTIRYFGRNMPSGGRWEGGEINIPASRHRHLASARDKTPWEGVNIYTAGADSNAVRIYVLPRPPDPEAEAKAAAAAAKKKAHKKSRGKKKGR